MTKQLKLANPLRAVDPETLAKDADLGGIGLDFTREPEGLSQSGQSAWQHLAATFASTPTRFREADRAAVTAYCLSVEMAERAAEALRQEGLLIDGRSSADSARSVRNPAWAMWRDANTAVRQWSVELALTPTSRQRARLDAGTDTSSEDNPFATPAS